MSFLGGSRYDSFCLDLAIIVLSGLSLVVVGSPALEVSLDEMRYRQLEKLFCYLYYVLTFLCSTLLLIRVVLIEAHCDRGLPPATAGISKITPLSQPYSSAKLYLSTSKHQLRQ
jgi:hypothetical protein